MNLSKPRQHGRKSQRPLWIRFLSLVQDQLDSSSPATSSSTNIPCAIYERESSADARAQGGSLDLHTDTGLKALILTDLLDEANGMMRMEGEAMKGYR